MGRTTYNVSTYPWLIDLASVSQNYGASIYWALVSDEDTDGNSRIKSGKIVSLFADGITPRKDATVAIASATEDGNGTATHTFSEDHNLKVGEKITISGFSTTEYNGNYTIASAPSSTTITVEGVTGTPVDDGGGGSLEVHAKGIILDGIVDNDNSRNVAGQGYIVGGVVNKTFLPDSGESDFETWLTELKDGGTGFVFESHSDNRS